MKKGIFRYGWRIGFGYLWWIFKNHIHCVPIHRANKQWSNQLEALLVFEEFKPVDRYVAIIGIEQVWIENHPYSSFSRYPMKKLDEVPTRFVTYLAERKCREQGIILRG